MAWIIVVALIISGIVYLSRWNTSKERTKRHNLVHQQYTPLARKFEFDPDWVMSQKRILERYHEISGRLSRQELTAFESQQELDEALKEILRLAEERDRLMAEISGRRIEFFE